MVSIQGSLFTTAYNCSGVIAIMVSELTVLNLPISNRIVVMIS